MVIVLKPKGSYLIGRFYRNRSAHLKLTNRDQAHQILSDRIGTRNVSYLNLKYQKSVTISCDLSIVALVTDRAWCERRITCYSGKKLYCLPLNIQILFEYPYKYSNIDLGIR